MASAAQIAANRENAKRPRTLSEETKESLRIRALKHGLASKLDANTVLREESKQEFETLRNALLTEATLGVPEEILLINLQAQGYWKLQRAMKMETGALNSSLIVAQIEEKVSKNLKEGAGLGSALAFALREQTAWFETLRRYSTTAERIFFKATRELAMIRKAGQGSQLASQKVASLKLVMFRKTPNPCKPRRKPKRTPSNQQQKKSPPHRPKLAVIRSQSCPPTIPAPGPARNSAA